MSIGALVREAEFGQSRADFTSKMSIALKKANETDYWLSLLNDTNYLNEKEYNSLDRDNTEVIKILISTIKTSKKNLKKIIIYYSLFTIH